MKKIDIDERWLHEIENGTKRIEGKKNSPKTRTLQLEIDDIINFVSATRSIAARVTNIRHYEGKGCLKKYLKTETLKRTLPGVKTIKEGISIYMSEPINWTQQEIDDYGIVAIEFTLI